MNSNQKEVQQTHLDEEKKVIRQLKQVYSQAIKDCETKISALNARTDMQNLQSIIYQKQYQEALESQLSAIMTNLQANEYQNISDYLTGSYTNGYVGAMYDIQKQTGCTVLTPINQSQVVAALQTDSKLSKSLYSRLGEDVTYLKKSVKAELSRGIANGSSWLDIASHIANGMNTPYKKALNNAIRIARTEGHRIQQQSQLDALKAAAEEGADVVKQWDSTLDSRTRPDHREADGQLRELDEKFRVGGEDMEAPGIGGSARNVCNCRCCLLQRARWALDEDELKTLQARASYYGLDKTASFNEFKSKYLNLPTNASTTNINPTRVKNAVSDAAEKEGITYNQVYPSTETLTEEQIISKLAGGDLTTGSCASLGLAYCGNKAGYDVTDYRGGNSQNFFSKKYNIKDILKLDGIKTTSDSSSYYQLTSANRLLKTVETGKQYYFVAGCHAAIVQRTSEGQLQYLELQSGSKDGWTNFNENTRYTLSSRFGCSSTKQYFKAEALMAEVDSFADCKEFQDILGYLNTEESEQKKGSGGYAK